MFPPQNRLFCALTFLSITFTLIIGLPQQQQQPQQQRHGRNRAKRYDGFQPLEAALIPQGSYVKLNSLSAYHSPSLQSFQSRPSLQQIDDDGALDVIIDQILASETKTPANPEKRSAIQTASKRWLAGIVPLQANRLPMGIFIPEETAEVRGTPTSTKRAKITLGIRRIFRKLRKLSLKRGATFDYLRTFNGLSPLDAVLIPRGYFIPLTSLSSWTGAAVVAKPFNSTGKPSPIMLGRRKRFVAGIEPLDSVLLPGGIFIPHRMAGLPELPPQILIPAGGGVNSTPAVTSK
ncbi:hypothetical protein BV898_06514 [Hypsibius exemplaris]|uniref:Uncharacterized protein n=1 Tax=Hypsibius exemplaris TaxID=2072580 RepID=A0A1W0WWH3_HYPEX|nr:hypothetical protein BV898_06514 [Hypsibius exemplaris]